MQLFYIFVFIALIATIARAEIELDEGVLVLTEENFDGAIADNAAMLVEVSYRILKLPKLIIYIFRSCLIFLYMKENVIAPSI